MPTGKNVEVELSLPKEIKHVVRLAKTDLDGTKKAAFALLKIPGINIRFAQAVLKAAQINPSLRLGELDDSQLKKIEEIIQNPVKYNIPYWMVNRVKDLQTGEHLHICGSDLFLKFKEDIDNMRKIKSWKGIRHALNLKVRGQHTRTTTRGGATVGVSRKKVKSGS
ncbi:MAG: 30S ribosomal protein S13 [Candidatus Odinarchaeum yellowstonii]|uniref:Small ribosomal subunit protein uS13 n=1 Tax=Odinarchaeota yellowstonii (strain LCB_4) TaxID=1841599 RepID=A0AAF0D1E2_ODILC|nr:MAG: 30S ribosomal protein S13 [Candidatus Odinarchaeum yellowstonii]